MDGRNVREHNWFDLHRQSSNDDRHLLGSWHQRGWFGRCSKHDGHSDPQQARLHADAVSRYDLDRWYIDVDCVVYPSGYLLHLDWRLLRRHDRCDL